MRLTRRALLPLLALPAACSLPPPKRGVTLPPEAPVAQGVTDPTRSAILSTSYVFNRPATVAGNPAAAAEALANLEYLAASIPADPTYRDFDPLARHERGGPRRTGP